MRPLDGLNPGDVEKLTMDEAVKLMVKDPARVVFQPPGGSVTLWKLMLGQGGNPPAALRYFNNVVIDSNAFSPEQKGLARSLYQDQ